MDLTNETRIAELEKELLELNVKYKDTKKRLTQWRNHYDSSDVVRLESSLVAGPLKIAAYKVRDIGTGEMNHKLQFHMTYDNHVLALMGEESAKLFAKFVTDIIVTDEQFEQEKKDKLR